MKNLIIFCVFVLLLVLAQFAQAQTVDEIISKHVQALGGKGNLDKIQSTIAHGTLSAQGAEIDVTITNVHNKLARKDINVMGMTGFDMITEKEAWTYMPFLGMQQPESKSAEEVKKNQTDLDIAGPLVDYAAKGHKAELQGKETVNGIESYKIKLTTAGGKSVIYYLDKETNMVTRTTETKTINGQKVDVQLDFADYKEIEAVKMPHSITNEFGTTFISGYKVNQKIPESAFKHDR